MMRSTGSVAGRAAVAIILLGLSGLSLGSAFCRADVQQPYSDFLKALDAGKVKEVTIEGEAITWRGQSGNLFETTRPNDPDLVRSLRDHDVTITVVPEHGENTFLYALINWFPMLLLIGVWIYFVSQFRRSKLGRQFPGLGGKARRGECAPGSDRKHLGRWVTRHILEG